MAAQRGDVAYDVPPHSRIFVIHGRGMTEDNFRDAFEKYGEIEDIWIVKDRRTMEDKGVTYIKFTKTSDAVLAVEEMSGRVIDGHSKPIKVIIASNKREGSSRDPKEEEKLVRLFVIVPKSFTSKDLKEEFEKFGEVEYTNILKDKNTGDSKGFAYVKFYRPFHAAKAYEECDPSFKPKFAEPRRSREDDYDPYDMGPGSGRGHKRGYYEDVIDDSPYGGRGGSSSRMMNQRNMMPRDMGPMRSAGFGMEPMPNMGSPYDSPRQGGPIQMLKDYPNSGCQRLHVTAALGLTQNYLTKLFSLIPGLEYCDLNEMSGTAYVRYTTPQCCAYARDKLDGFEYPIGTPLRVQFTGSADEHQEFNYGRMDHGPQLGGISQATMQRAALVLEKAGINPDALLRAEPLVERVPYCNIQLPVVQPMRPEDTDLCQRLFIVCQPTSVPEKVLRDAFCRFGNLIDVYLLPGRNYGYAKFANKESAMKAIQLLHGQNLAGSRLKVLEAEPPKPGYGEDYRDLKKQRI